MKKIIIIGLTPQGLAMLRILSRAGHQVIAFTNTKKVVGYYSKYGDKRIFNDVVNLKSQIEKIVKAETKKIDCIITSGELLALIISEYPELYDICNVQSGPLHLVKMLSHKNQMYDFATSRGLKSAKFKTLYEYKPGDLKFPIILKKNYEIPLFFKIKKINSDYELSIFSKKIDTNNYKDILIQEYINIENYIFITYQAYLHYGEIKCYFIARQTRRLSTGLTCFIEEIKNNNLRKKIKNLSENLLVKTNYNGFIEVEYIYNTDNEDIIFMETNTRPCGTHSAFSYKFNNLHELFNQINNPPNLITNNKKIVWINIARDIKARLINKDFRHLSQFFKAKRDILDKDDLKPFIMQFFK